MYGTSDFWQRCMRIKSASYLFGKLLSKTFRIERGKKQGDPLSPALFNAGLENIMRQIQPALRRKGYGVALCEGGDDLLTNLFFCRLFPLGCVIGAATCAHDDRSDDLVPPNGARDPHGENEGAD